MFSFPLASPVPGSTFLPPFPGQLPLTDLLAVIAKDEPAAESPLVLSLLKPSNSNGQGSGESKPSPEGRGNLFQTGIFQKVENVHSPAPRWAGQFSCSGGEKITSLQSWLETGSVRCAAPFILVWHNYSASDPASSERGVIHLQITVGTENHEGNKTEFSWVMRRVERILSVTPWRGVLLFLLLSDGWLWNAY